MKFRLSLVLLLASSLVLARDSAAAASIRGILEKQADEWNRGNVTAFVQSYAEDCTFVGTAVTQGRAAVEERYRRNYATPAAMGHLAFSDLKIKEIGNRVAIVTGAFHLQRTAAGGGDKNGIFSLVFERQNGAWLIVLDHTS